MWRIHLRIDEGVRALLLRGLKSVLWIALISLSVVEVAAQSARERCEQSIVEFVGARSEMPEDFACLMHGSRVEGELGKEPTEMEIKHIYVECDNKKKGKYSYFASGIRFPDATKYVWEHSVKNRKFDMRRFGYGNQADRLRFFSAPSGFKIEDVRPLRFPKFDPFNLPYANDGAYLAHSIPKAFAEEIFVLNGSLSDAVDLGSGKTQGTWDIQGRPGAVVDVVLDEANSGFPVRVEWRTKRSRDASVSETKRNAHVETLVTTEYRRVRLGGKVIRLPFKIELESVRGRQQEKFASTSLEFVWIGQIGNLQFPPDSHSDWINPVLRLFDSHLVDD